MAFINAMQAIQKNVWDYARDTKNINLLLAVIAGSRLNRTIEMTDFGMMGKLRTLKINFLAPICDDDGTCDPNICNPGRVIEPSQMFFNISQCTASDVYQVNKEDIRFLDGDVTFSDYAKRVVANAMVPVRDKLHAAIAAELVGEVGIIPLADGTGVADLLINWVNPENGYLNPQGYNTIQRSFADGGFSSNPIIVGGPTVDDWKRNRAIATANNFGQMLERLQSGDNAWYDPIIPTTFADSQYDHILAYDPEVLKFVNFSMNSGIFQTDLNSINDINRLYWRGSESLIEGTIIDPRTGLLWDLEIHYDVCLKAWKIQWQIRWDIFFMPPRQCNIQGVNGIYHFLACLAPAVECPTPAVLSPISTDQDFEYQTSGQIDYTYFIQKLQVGSLVKEFEGLNQVDNIAELVTMLNDFLFPLGIVLTANGTILEYTGTSPITILINGGATNDGETFTFVAA